MLMVILKNISCGYRKYFSSVGNSIFIIFRDMNERIYIKKKKKMEFLVERSMRTWKIIYIRNGDPQNPSPPDMSDFSRHLLLAFLLSGFACRGAIYLSIFWVVVRSFGGRRRMSLDARVRIRPKLLSLTRAKSSREPVDSQLWAGAEISLNVGWVGFGGKAAVTFCAKDDGCFPRRWWRFTSWRRQDQDRNFRTKERWSWFSGVHNFVLVIN